MISYLPNQASSPSWNRPFAHLCWHWPCGSALLHLQGAQCSRSKSCVGSGAGRPRSGRCRSCYTDGCALERSARIQRKSCNSRRSSKPSRGTAGEDPGECVTEHHAIRHALPLPSKPDRRGSANCRNSLPRKRPQSALPIRSNSILPMTNQRGYLQVPAESSTGSRGSVRCCSAPRTDIDVDHHPAALSRRSGHAPSFALPAGSLRQFD